MEDRCSRFACEPPESRGKKRKICGKVRPVYGAGPGSTYPPDGDYPVNQAIKNVTKTTHKKIVFVTAVFVFMAIVLGPVIKNIIGLEWHKYHYGEMAIAI